MTYSPEIIAHRGGTADAPENTVTAIRHALDNGADTIWVTLQLSKDNQIVLYRPLDLKVLTNRMGAISAYNANELAETDAGWSFTKDKGKSYPFRGKGIAIPTLESVLTLFPKTAFYLDIKSPDADPVTFGQTLLTTLKKTGSLSRTRVYSTDSRYVQALPAAIPRFETRDDTRTVLANITMAHQCPLTTGTGTGTARWFGLELRREVRVVEKYTLGEGVSTAYLTWDKEAMTCFREKGKAHIILFGINSVKDYQTAVDLGADGVLVDSPLEAKTYRSQVKSSQ
ncbi:glycerophosphodiester phosphodiesterase family protein [Klebsiella michiganensis]|uniref:glycerophosphodiester phosphodiesterase family protein n=1 Tax=Klebsiella michiganensis TaxID=1134687 RepID=UPI0025706853|nr:glycerophosphodiester phosphodiesterase family protein [Klebsiella michiganensis]MDL4454797.1 glycerophosphodiester phosphodiesterase family protein [Klebsiella michiganensis]